MTQKPNATERPAPATTGLLVLLLRYLRGWDQADLAEAVGVDPKTIQRYESGERQPSPERLGQICAAVGLPLPLAQQAWLPLLRLSLELANGERKPPSGTVYEEAARLGQEIGDRLGEISKSRLLVLLTDGERAWEEREGRYPPRPEHREAAREAWRRIRPYSREDRAFLLEAAEDLWTWALAELLCAESLESGGALAPSPGEEAEELANLAIEAAERVDGSEAWRSRLLGFATATLANALAAKGDLEGADETLARAWELWNAGGDGPHPLEGWRLLAIEADLRRAQGRFEEALRLHERALAAQAQHQEREGFAPGGTAHEDESSVN